MPASPRPSMKSPLSPDPASAAVIELAWTILDTFARMKAASDRLTAEEGQTTPRLAVLREVALHGPLTVAEVARLRHVARQGVQRLADELATGGLVTFVRNPAHQRSPLLRLTRQGRRVTARLLSRQDAIARALAPALDRSEIRRAIAVLRAFADRLEEE